MAGWAIDYTYPGLMSTNDTIVDIVNAVNERCDAAAISRIQLGGIDVDVTKISLYSTDQLMSVIDIKISQLIPRYADHTQAIAGKFVNLSAIPMWTEVSLLVSIGASTRISGKIYPSTDWTSQVYKMVNKLRWPKAYLSFAEGFGYVKSRGGGITSWATLVSTWPSSWSTLVFSISAIESAGQCDINTGIPYYQAGRIGKRYKYNTSGSLAHSADMYYYTEPPYDALYFYTAIFDDEGFGWTVNRYNNVQSLPVGVRGTGIIDFRDIASGVPPEPPALNRYRQGWRSLSTNNICILKYDVVGGFEYID